VVLSGNMQYPPNRAAYEVLVAEVLPLVRAVRPDARVRVVGRAAATLPPVAGVELLSDVPDMHAALRDATVAVAPLEGGTGAPNKVLEAAVAGCAVVAPQWVMDAFDLELRGSDGAAATAAAVLALLDDPAGRAANVAVVRAAVARSRPDHLAIEAERLLAAVAGSRAASA
ncbi:MAG: glycosyltransferase, partial [Solirubrobacteraceae bacterium]|nr:glycosyltransferase [Patulibacter sp.]